MPIADETSPARRFPYAAAVLACAAIGLAVWLWMRFSYAWDVTPEQLWPGEPFAHVSFEDLYQPPSASEEASPSIPSNATLAGRYARLTEGAAAPDRRGASRAVAQWVWVRGADGMDQHVSVAPGSVLFGRVVWARHRYDIYWPRPLGLDAAASRFTGASVAGIVVAAWCSFVFGLTLRRWLIDHRARLDADIAGAACGDDGGG